jgi:hypothetical protein
MHTKEHETPNQIREIPNRFSEIPNRFGQKPNRFSRLFQIFDTTAEAAEGSV